MKHDWANADNILGYDPAYWRAAKKTAWAFAGALAAAVLGLVALHLWPERLEFIFIGLGFLALTGLGMTWRDMWDNRHYHPRYRRFSRKP